MAAPASSGPRVRAAALILVDGRVVLARHRAGSAVYHLLPGGGVDYRETLEDAVVREVREETGLEVAVDAFLFANDTIDPTGSRHVVNLTFTAHVIGGAITDSPDDQRVEAIDLADPAKLGDYDLRPPYADAIQRFLAGKGSGSGYLGSLFTAGR
ncbi:MAG: NUDIX hydrolase [Coriobacteriia bacterium]|nr:NUDIX hydrolase [Coriobacteriia bacterium]